MGWPTWLGGGAADSGSSVPETKEQKTEKWKAAFSKCGSSLESLAEADSEGDRIVARAWWVVCMATQCGSCSAEYQKWVKQATAVLKKPQVGYEETVTVVNLPEYNPMAECVVQAGRTIGVEVADTLDTVENYGMQEQQKRAGGAWKEAVDGIEPARRQIHHHFIPNGPSRDEKEMSMEEFRGCQLWMYGLATRLSTCKTKATEFASVAGMPDPSSPFKGFQEEKWNPETAAWQGMEDCVRRQASKAGADVFDAWQAP